MLRKVCLPGLLWLVFTPSLSAQNLSVQQPVFQQFSAGTTVSVPDRGAAFIGGVGQAGSARRSFGPFRSGTGSGMFAESSSLHARVWIHDMAAMDRELLDSVTVSVKAPLTNADRAYSLLANRPADLQVHSKPRPVAPTVPVSRLRHGIPELLAKAQAAQAKGYPELAKVYWRVAARQGSGEAVKLLAGVAR